MSSIKLDEHFLVLDYLSTKLKQAQSDVELFTVLIDEVNKMKANSGKLNLTNNFLKIVHSSQEE